MPVVPIISILVIAGIARPYLKRALRSLIEQRFTSWEAIVIECCATKGDSAQVFDAVRDMADPRIVMVRCNSEHHFPPFASQKWNFGACYARGSLLSWMDDDDAKGANWLEAMSSPLLTDQSLMCTVSDGVDIDSEDRLGNHIFGSPTSLDWQILVKPTFVTTGQLMVRKSTFNQMGGFDESFGASEDYEFCLRLSRYPWHFVPNVVSFKRTHESNAGCQFIGEERLAIYHSTLYRIIRKHDLAPDSCRGCSMSLPDIPYVRAVPGDGWRLWHRPECADAAS